MTDVDCKQKSRQKSLEIAEQPAHDRYVEKPSQVRQPVDFALLDSNALIILAIICFSVFKCQSLLLNCFSV